MMPEAPLLHRAARAAQDLREALSLGAPAPEWGGEPMPSQALQPLPAPLAQHPPTPPGAPQGALSAPLQRPALSPLQTMSDFRSPPVAAALQGAVGREGPVGFADGGFVVVRR